MSTTPIPELARRAKAASRAMATATTDQKNEALTTAAELLLERADEILEANGRRRAGRS